MSRIVQFTEFGGPEVLGIVTVEPPHAGPGEVRVRVAVTGINPVDHKILRGGAAAEFYGAHLPSGNGNDFAGTIDEVGADVTQWRVGDVVLGGSRFHAQADFVVIAADRVIRVPDGLEIEQAGGLDIAGRAALASVASLALGAADTVLVSAAAGGVGILASQLALRTGATVVGTASATNQEFLRSLGVIPVVYGDGMVDRIRAAVPTITAVLDNHGAETIDAGLALGVPGSRINTIAARGHASEHGIAGIGGDRASLDDLAGLASLIAVGEVVYPIDSVFPLERVGEAYERMLAGHLRGKIVLVTA
jgi:NADPH:quinone reductase-like Zn-dependent oxidoreductase